MIYNQDEDFTPTRTNQAKHTPGPWEVQDIDNPFWYIFSCEGDFLIAKIPKWVDDAPGESIANARLIAAAPDLLEACERGLGVLLGEPACAIYKAHADILRAAITRAAESPESESKG